MRNRTYRREMIIGTIRDICGLLALCIFIPGSVLLLKILLGGS